MVTHFAKVTPNEYGGFRTSTLCGRTNSQSKDGMNSSSNEDEVTCKFCMKALLQRHRSAIGSLNARLSSGR